MIILAYIDPGLGALLWQAIVAGIVGFLFYLKKTRQLIVGAVRKIFGRGQKSPAPKLEIPAEEKVKAKSNVR